MVKIEDGEVIQEGLPTTGYLKDGSSVSGYNNLDKATLKEEGWLPLDDKEPKYDSDTHYLIDDGYEILKTKVNKKYKIIEIPEEVESADEKIKRLEELIDAFIKEGE